MTKVSKNEKIKKKLAKKRNRKLQKRVKHLTKKMETIVSVAAVSLCVLLVLSETLEEKRERNHE